MLDLPAITRKCLRGNLGEVLREVRKVPKESIDKSFMQFYLAQSTKYVHWPSISFIWNTFVVRRELMVVRPNILADIAKISVHENKYGFTRTVLRHYNRYYISQRGIRWDGYRYLLLNAHIEIYAKRPNTKANFKKKWHAYIVELDNELTHYPVSVYDFPNLTTSMRDIPIERLKKWLLNDCKEGSMNPYSMPMFLNMILLQPHVSGAEKIDVFKEFVQKTSVDLSRYLQDSVQILFHECDGVSMRDLVEELQALHMTFDGKTTRKLQSLGLLE